MSAQAKPVYKYHAFICATQRPEGHPRGCCTSKGGGAPLVDRLYARVESDMLTDVGVTKTGCLGFCGMGPVMVVYPEGVWYSPKSADDIDAIVDSHFKRGEPVARLQITPER